MRLAGDNIPDTIGEGQKLRVTATVESYNDKRDLLRIHPVSTELK